MGLQLPMYVRFMTHIRTIGVVCLLVKIHPTIAQVWTLIAHEASALLQRVGIADPNSTRHVCHGQSFDREAPIHGLAANEDVRVRSAPINLRRFSTDCIYRNYASLR